VAGAVLSLIPPTTILGLAGWAVSAAAATGAVATTMGDWIGKAVKEKDFKTLIEGDTANQRRVLGAGGALTRAAAAAGRRHQISPRDVMVALIGRMPETFWTDVELMSGVAVFSVADAVYSWSTENCTQTMIRDTIDKLREAIRDTDSRLVELCRQRSG